MEIGSSSSNSSRADSRIIAATPFCSRAQGLVRSGKPPCLDRRDERGDRVGGLVREVIHLNTNVLVLYYSLLSRRRGPSDLARRMLGTPRPSPHRAARRRRCSRSSARSGRRGRSRDREDIESCERAERVGEEIDAGERRRARRVAGRQIHRQRTGRGGEALDGGDQPRRRGERRPTVSGRIDRAAGEAPRRCRRSGSARRRPGARHRRPRGSTRQTPGPAATPTISARARSGVGNHRGALMAAARTEIGTRARRRADRRRATDRRCGSARAAVTFRCSARTVRRGRREECRCFESW